MIPVTRIGADDPVPAWPIPPGTGLSGGFVPSGRARGTSCFLGALLLVGCQVPSQPGEAQLISQGMAPATLSSPATPLSGLLEISRVHFEGNALNDKLIGGSGRARTDGQVLVTGLAGFSVPATSDFARLSTFIPAAPPLSDGSTLRCEVQPGKVRTLSAIPGLEVDMGATLSLSGGTTGPSFTLTHLSSSSTATSSGKSGYAGTEIFRAADNARWSPNWLPGATLELTGPGAEPPADSAHVSVPYRWSAPGVPLPLEMTGLAVNGTAVAGPVLDPISRDVLTAAVEPVVPESGAALELSWTPWEGQSPLTVSLEYYGQGEGFCPSACASRSDCCASDTDCGADARCEESGTSGKRCYPARGDLSDRLGALVCSAPDSGQATVDASLIDAFTRTLPEGATRARLLRVARVTQTTTPLPPTLLSDGSRQDSGPMLSRASDIRILRLAEPDEGASARAAQGGAP